MTAIAERRALPPPAASPVESDDATPAVVRLPRNLAILVHSVAALCWTGVFIFYVRVWLAPREGKDELIGEVTRVVEGRAGAPFQYRILVPRILMWAHRELGWQIGYAEFVLDIVMLGIGIGALHLVLRRLDLEVWAIAIALYGSFVMVGTLWWGKFETITSFAAMSVATWAMLRDDRRRWVALAVVAFVLAGTRTDLLLAVSVAVLARWLFVGRRPSDLVGGIVLGAAGVGATLALVAMYPDANYDESVGMFQLSHNLQPLMLLTAAAFLLRAIGPYLLVRSEPGLRSLISERRAVMVPLLALVVAEVGSVLIVGRADEVRLFFPISGALGILAVCGWRTVLGPYVAGGLEHLDAERVEIASPPR